MKKLAFLLLFVAGGVLAQTDVVKFKAKIANRNSDSLMIRDRTTKHTIKLNADGTFTDSFSVTPGIHQLFDGTEYTLMYLKNGYNLVMNLDAKNFDESIVYTGAGSKENNFLAQKTKFDIKFDETIATYNDAESLAAALKARASGLTAQLVDPELDAEFVKIANEIVDGDSKNYAMMYAQAIASKKMNGSDSPQFDYENHKGGKTKLADLKGKYVYIDNWATWCGPCRAEIPSLKKVEEKYHGKNIEFVSISIDEQKDHEKWQKFVTDKQLGGIQLFADKNWSSDFIRAFGINSIPRFILIGPDGKVVDADAKRPSDPALQTQLDALLK